MGRHKPASVSLYYCQNHYNYISGSLEWFIQEETACLLCSVSEILEENEKCHV